MAKLSSTSKGGARPKIIIDSDRDGVPDHKDCRPLNSKMHNLTSKEKASLKKAVAKAKNDPNYKKLTSTQKNKLNKALKTLATSKNTKQMDKALKVLASTGLAGIGLVTTPATGFIGGLVFAGGIIQAVKSIQEPRFESKKAQKLWKNKDKAINSLERKGYTRKQSVKLVKAQALRFERTADKRKLQKDIRQENRIVKRAKI